MIEILTPDDVSKIKDCYIAEYIKNLLTNLLTQTSDCLLETVGGIFYVENEKDFDNYKKFGLSSKITESRFEWIDLIGNDFLDGCIVLDNDRAINIVGKGLSIDEKRLIIETEPKSFFTAPFLTSIVVWSKINSSADEG